jgi:hypothetical protein
MNNTLYGLAFSSDGGSLLIKYLAVGHVAALSEECWLGTFVQNICVLHK